MSLVTARTQTPPASEITMRKHAFSSLLAALWLSLHPLSGFANTFDRLQQPALTSTHAAHGLLIDIQQVPGRQRLVAVGEQGVIVYSDDHGQHWQQAKSPVSVLLTALSFADAKSGWAVGHDGTILHSSDGGLNWQVQAAGLQLKKLQQQALQALVDHPPADSSAQQRQDWSYQLDNVSADLQDRVMPTLLDVLFLDARHGFASGGYGALFETRDGGQHWQSIGYRLPNPDRLHLNAMLLSHSGRLLIAGEAGLLVYSDDLGQHWQASDSPYDGSYFALAETDQLYVMGLRGHLFRSRDGVRWQPVTLPSDATLNGAIARNGKLYLLGEGGALLAQTSGGFAGLSMPQRRTLSAGVAVGNRLWLVGEGGVTEVSATGEEK